MVLELLTLPEPRLSELVLVDNELVVEVNCEAHEEDEDGNHDDGC